MGDRTGRHPTVIIGGGQAGLSVGYYLSRQDRPLVILDAFDRIGDNWRTRWDSLRLFTPARYDGLPGMRFPAPGGSFPTGAEMGDYLEAYAERFGLPTRTGVVVDGVARDGDGFVVTAGDRRFQADNVVVATGAYRSPRVPGFASQLDPGIVQLHSSEYRNPSQLQPGGVLVVGAGNSGADIGLEVVREHPTSISGRDTGHVPFRIETWVARNLLIRLVRFTGQHVLTMRTPLGRKAHRHLLAHGGPLIRVKPKDIAAAGIERVPRTSGARDGRPILEDGRALDVSNVIWCTGFRHDFRWIHLPVFDDGGLPIHQRGVVPAEPGLYFMSLPFQYSESSGVITGVARDAKYVARHLLTRAPSTSRRAVLAGA